MGNVQRPRRFGLAWRKRLGLWSAGATAGLALAAAITFANPGAGRVADDPGATNRSPITDEVPAFEVAAPAPSDTAVGANPPAEAPGRAPPAADEPPPAQVAAPEPEAVIEPQPATAAPPAPPPAPQPAPAAPEARPATPPPAAEPPSAQEYKPNFYLPEAPAGGTTGPEQRFFDGLNAERAKAGLAPYVLDASLSHVARIRSRQLADQGYFGHTDPFGYSMYVELLGYFGISYAWAGENLAMNNYDPAIAAERAVVSLMNSATHRANILDTDFRRVGVGEFTAPDGKHYYTTIFVG